MTRILIRNGFIATVNGAGDTFPGGYVAVEDGKIAEVGPNANAPAPDGFGEVIDADNMIVTPGLINMHQHHWYTLFKGLADGYLLEDWVTDFLLPLTVKLDRHAMAVSSTLAGLEMLATGTTCSLNHSVTTTTPDMVAATIEPQLELGIRQVFAKDMRCRTKGNPGHPLKLQEALSAFEEEYERWHGAGKGLVGFAMALEANAHWVAAGMSSNELILQGYELAQKLGLKITSHTQAGTFSLEKGMLKYLRETGRSDVRYLMQMGILDPAWLLIHAIHVSDLDLEHMARTGAHMVYTPTSEAMRGGGIGPASNALRAGVNVALGTDGPMVDYSVDMVEQMKVCALMQHVRHLDPTRVPAVRALEMATINGARALGLDDKIGSLEPGKQADIAVFDLDRPYIGVLHQPLSSFICAGHGSNAHAVLVDGKIVYRAGAFANLEDTASVIATAGETGAALIKSARLESRFQSPALA